MCMYQQLNLKNKLSKQEQRQNRGYGEHFDDCQMGGGFGGMGEEVRGLRSTKRHPYFAIYNVYFLAQVFEWKIRKNKKL